MPSNICMGELYRVSTIGPAVHAVVAQVAFALSLHAEPKLVLAQVVLGEEGVEVGGEPFVEPDVRPVLAGEQVAKPLVGQLVSDQAVLVPFQGLDLVEQGRVGHRGGRSVFHASAELGKTDLGVLADRDRAGRSCR